jgi:electron-transferring-flavoprotein dehydrogenase
MWENMCPAQVYSVPDEVKDQMAQNGGLPEDTLVDMQITPSNCVQCGAITAKGGRLTPPEGGDGPNYQQT